LATRHLGELDRKIAEIQSMRRALGDLIERCRGDQRPDCPILDGFSDSQQDLVRPDDAGNLPERRALAS
jgi:MerR family copper efflux transcriptional regulator